MRIDRSPAALTFARALAMGLVVAAWTAVPAGAFERRGALQAGGGSTGADRGAGQARPPSPGPEAQMAAETARVPARATLRAAPSATAAMVTLVAAGTTVEVLGREGDFVKVLLPPDTRRVRLAGYLQARDLIVTPRRGSGAAGAAPPPAGSRGARPGRFAPTGYRLFGEVGYVSVLAADSFRAMFDTSRLVAPGGGVEVLLGPGLFVRAGLSRMRIDGERAWVYNGEVFRLGTPVTVTMTPVEVTVGWRFKPWHGARPYAGGGAGMFAYDEVTSLAGSSDDVTATDACYHLVGGAEVAVWKRVSAGVEFQYRSVPGIIGTSGVSKEFAETDLGGTSLRLRVAFAF